jgi:hypoxanthine phosphoribosyltransferase
LSYQIDQIIIEEKKISKRVKELGKEISKDYRELNPLLVCILRGAVVFLSDLIREIDIPVEIDFMAVSSYGSSTKTSGVVRILKDLNENIQNRHVILVEDIVDTGLTLNYLMKNLQEREPASLTICSFLLKESKQKVHLDIKYLGFSIPDYFVVGYGLDYAQKFRNLPYVASVKKVNP